MTLPTTLDALIIVALIFIPGMICGQLIRRTIPHFSETIDARHFLSMGALGLLLHTPLFPLWTRHVFDWYLNNTIDNHWFATYVWFLVAVFLWPVIAGVVLTFFIRIEWVDAQLDRLGLGYVDRTPSAWDWAIDVHESRWVRVYLRDGTVIGGLYGTSSFASLYSTQRDVYLEQMWQLDEKNNFVEPMVNTDGVWIGHEIISHIVFQIGEDA